MVRTEVTCDRCRALIPADRTNLVVACGPLRAHPGGSRGPSIDLYRGSAEGLLAWLRAGAESGAVPPGSAQ